MTMLSAQPSVQIDSGDSFWIENHHPTETLNFVWNKLPYNVAPGKKKIVPFEVICLYFGDPRSKPGVIGKVSDSRGPGTVPERYSEVQRLAVRYGVYEQGMENIAQAMEDENARLEVLDKQSITRVRKLKDSNFHAIIKTLEDVQIITPLFDPDGSATYGYTTDEGRLDDVASIIDEYRRRLDALEGKKTILEDNGDNDDDGIEIDNPAGP